MNRSFKRENYKKGFKTFPVIVNFDFQHYYRVVTPLKPLLSPIKAFEKDKVLPKIYIYNPKYFSPVRNQGRCGGCWAFVICSLLSDNVTIKTFKFGKNLNVQQLLSCYPSGGACEGEAPEDALMWLSKTNFKLSIDNKYLQVITDCEFTNTGISVKKNSVRSLCKYIKRECITDPTKEETGLLNENIYNMKMQLLKYGSFFGSINVYQDFFNFKGNKAYTKTSNDKIGGHAITIVGWCDKGVDKRDGFEDGYWVCKNSWGDRWASEYEFTGHFAIKMGSNECGIESRSGCAESNVDYDNSDKQIPSYLVYNNYIELLKYIIQQKKLRSVTY